jgi:hypothetical protein
LSIPSENDSAKVITNDALNRQILINPPAGATWSAAEFVGDSLGAGMLTFRLSSGLLDVGHFSVGEDGHASFFQNGGTLHTGRLLLSLDQTGRGSYDLSGGTILADSASLSNGGAPAIFHQHGGQFIVNTDLDFNGNGTRADISAGSIRSARMTVGAIFSQNGGMVDVDELLIGGAYEWNAGALELHRRLEIAPDARLVLPKMPSTLELDGPVILGDRVSFVNAKKSALLLGEHSLLIKPASLDLKKIFGTFANAGISYATDSSSPLVIPAGRVIYGFPELEEAVVINGAFVSPPDGQFTLKSRVQVNPGGRLKASSLVTRADSEILGGRIDADYLSVEVGGFFLDPFRPPLQPVFSQRGGDVRVGSLSVGSIIGGDGIPVSLYRQFKGTLTVRNENIGDGFFFVQSRGRFEQRGGSHVVTDSLVIGKGEKGLGEFNIGGGELRAADILISTDDDIHFPFQPPHWGTGRFHIISRFAKVTVTDRMFLGPNAEFSAAPGSGVHFQGANLAIATTNSSALSGLANLRLIFEGGMDKVSGLEVAAEDRGPGASGYVNNFVIDTLQVGGSNPAAVRLQNWYDNEPGSSIPDAIYVNHLVLYPHSQLDLNGLHLYYHQIDDRGGSIIGDAAISCASFSNVPEPVSSACMSAWLLVASQRRSRTRRSRSSISLPRR